MIDPSKFIGSRVFVRIRIWSFEHDAWWAPTELGYRRATAQAGLYDPKRAAEIVERANIASDERHPDEAIVETYETKPGKGPLGTVGDGLTHNWNAAMRVRAHDVTGHARDEYGALEAMLACHRDLVERGELPKPPLPPRARSVVAAPPPTEVDIATVLHVLCAVCADEVIAEHGRDVVPAALVSLPLRGPSAAPGQLVNFTLPSPLPGCPSHPGGAFRFESWPVP